VLSAVSAVWMLVQLQILSCAFDLAVAGLGILGFHATRHRQRSLLLLVREALRSSVAHARSV
jgi:hypothetical protein